MAARRITISCPGCGEQHKQITLDVAEQVLIYGCVACREKRARA